MQFYTFCLRCLAPLGRIFFRLRFVGMEHIPSGGGYIVCCNHRSVIDPYLLAIPFRGRQIRYMAKSELFEDHGRLARWLLYRLGAFPVRREKGDAESVRTALNIVRAGGVLGIFPQGRCVPGNVPFQAKAGAALIAEMAGAPVLPACIYCEAPRIRPFCRITVRFGQVIPAGGAAKDKKGALAGARAAASRIAAEINRLLEEKH